MGFWGSTERSQRDFMVDFTSINGIDVDWLSFWWSERNGEQRPQFRLVSYCDLPRNMAYFQCVNCIHFPVVNGWQPLLTFYWDLLLVLTRSQASAAKSMRHTTTYVNLSPRIFCIFLQLNINSGLKTQDFLYLLHDFPRNQSVFETLPQSGALQAGPSSNIVWLFFRSYLTAMWLQWRWKWGYTVL